MCCLCAQWLLLDFFSMKVFSLPLNTCTFFASMVLPERHFPWLSAPCLKTHHLDSFWIFILLFWVVPLVLPLVFLFEEVVNSWSLSILSRPLRILWTVAIFLLCHILSSLVSASLCHTRNPFQRFDHLSCCSLHLFYFCSVLLGQRPKLHDCSWKEKHLQ